MEPPYLKFGPAGVVLRARARTVVTLSGPAVQAGVPFDGSRQALRVQWRDGVGRPVRRGPPHLSSDDLVVKGGHVRMKRPVPVPRLWLCGGVVVVVAFRLRRFQGVQTAQHPGRYDVRVFFKKGATVSRQSDGRRLWFLPGYEPLYITWDRRHVLVGLKTGEGFQLRRLRDGAVLLESCWPWGQKCQQQWRVYEGGALCRTGCCHLGLTELGVVWLPSPGPGALMTPCGDRAFVWPEPAGLCHERNKCGTLQAVSLPSPKRPFRREFSRELHATQAGELVWSYMGTLHVWHEETGERSWPVPGAGPASIGSGAYLSALVGGHLLWMA